jgi:hypothetical protein
MHDLRRRAAEDADLAEKTRRGAGSPLRGPPVDDLQVADGQRGLLRRLAGCASPDCSTAASQQKNYNVILEKV